MMKRISIILFAMFLLFGAVSCRNTIFIPIFDTPGSDKPSEPVFSVWDGSLADTAKLVARIQESDEIHISSASELAALADIVNGTAEDLPKGFSTKLTGKTIVLDVDIDLADLPWTGIGQNPRSMMGQNNGNPFEGIFDGNNHTIKGLNVSAERFAGLFGYVHNASIKNLVVEGDSTATGTKASGLLVSNAYYDRVAGEYTIENIDAFGISSGATAGGVIGLLYVNPSADMTITVNVSDITMTGSVTSPEMAGGVIERIDIGERGNGIVNISDIESSAEVVVTGETESRTISAGGIFGRINSSGTLNIGNETKNGIVNKGNISITSTDKELRAGGIIGDLQENASGTICNVRNEGNITSSCQSIIGGVIGSASGGDLSVSDAVNAGDLSGQGNYLGGIFGGVYDIDLTVNGAENNGEVKGTLPSNAPRSMYAGGIAGFIFRAYADTSATISDVANAVAVSVEDLSDTYNAYVGGIIGGIYTISGSLSEWSAGEGENAIGSTSDSEGFTVTPAL